MLTGSNNFVMRLVSPGRQARGIYFANLCAERPPPPPSLSPTTVGSNLQVNRLRRFVTRASLAEFISFRLLARPSNWLACLSLSRSSLSLSLSLSIGNYIPAGRILKPLGNETHECSVSARVTASSLLSININNATNVSVARSLSRDYKYLFLYRLLFFIVAGYRFSINSCF